MNFLLVGGSHDGEHVDADDRREYLAMPVHEELELRAYDINAAAADCSYRIEYYRVMLMRFDCKEFKIMICEGLSEVEAFEKLLEGYNPEVKRDE